jgi:hypothetical protein
MNPAMSSAMNPAMNPGTNPRICVCGLIPYELGTLMIGPPMMGAEGGHQHRSMYTHLYQLTSANRNA